MKKWTKITIHTTTDAEEDISFLLSELGIDAVEIEDLLEIPDEKQGGTFAELQPDRPQDDGKAMVHFYLAEDEDPDEVMGRVSAAIDEYRSFRPIEIGAIEVSVTEEEDWVNNWKEFFHSFTVGDIFVKPTWEEAPEDLSGKLLVQIDPGVAFGTGKHESTQLVIRQMPAYVKEGSRILDVGFGSGILSVIALKMGASHVTGTDIDEDCLGSVRENFTVNELSERDGDFYIGNLSTDPDLRETVGKETYDVVFANILADIIIGMAEPLYDTVKPGGVLITSGIIDFKQAEVREALRSVGFSIADEQEMGEWRSITARKEMKN